MSLSAAREREQCQCDNDELAVHRQRPSVIPAAIICERGAPAQHRWCNGARNDYNPLSGAVRKLAGRGLDTK
jgi:hypothetical protein